jgi:hypothetical protein
MVTIVGGRVPTDELALNATFERLPGLEVECERVVESGTSVMPLVWVRHGDRKAVETALADDPTVEAVTLLSEFDGESLYRMEWIGHVRLLLHMLANGSATVLDARGRNGDWHLRVLYPDR